MIDEIPVMTDPLSQYWHQPDRSEIEIDDTHAIMKSDTFDKLLDYSRSQPTGVYVGKMWKCEHFIDKKSVWFLKWFGFSSEPDMCTINKRKIIIS
jgi:hypothetical protein